MDSTNHMTTTTANLQSLKSVKDKFNMVLQIQEFVQSKGSGGKNLPQNL